MGKNPLGLTTVYPETLDTRVLCPISRRESRVPLGLTGEPPFEGVDRWTAYEISWLNERGVPELGIGAIEYPADSEYLVESKSLKLFLGSLNFTTFPSRGVVEELIATTLRNMVGAEVVVRISPVAEWSELRLVSPPGECIDGDDPRGAGEIAAGSEVVEETLYSNLLRSLCPVTAQPDWGTLVVRYRGRRIERGTLLSSLIAHRRYQGFHEACCERIFMELLAVTEASSLQVGCCYTRRGGLDINPERWLPGSKRVSLSGRLARQ